MSELMKLLATSLSLEDGLVAPAVEDETQTELESVTSEFDGVVENVTEAAVALESLVATLEHYANSGKGFNPLEAALFDSAYAANARTLGLPVVKLPALESFSNDPVAATKLSMEMVSVLSILHVAVVEPIKKLFIYVFNFLKKIADRFAKFLNRILGRRDEVAEKSMIEKLQHYASTGAKMQKVRMAHCEYISFDKYNTAAHRQVTVANQVDIVANTLKLLQAAEEMLAKNGSDIASHSKEYSQFIREVLHSPDRVDYSKKIPDFAVDGFYHQSISLVKSSRLPGEIVTPAEMGDNGLLGYHFKTERGFTLGNHTEVFPPSAADAVKMDGYVQQMFVEFQKILKADALKRTIDDLKQDIEMLESYKHTEDLHAMAGHPYEKRPTEYYRNFHDITKAGKAAVKKMYLYVSFVVNASSYGGHIHKDALRLIKASLESYQG